MDLQLALITLGLILIVIIYVASKLVEKRNNAKTDSKQKFESSLEKNFQELEESDDDAELGNNDIPVLDLETDSVQNPEKSYLPDFPETLYQQGHDPNRINDDIETLDDIVLPETDSSTMIDEISSQPVEEIEHENYYDEGEDSDSKYEFEDGNQIDQALSNFENESLLSEGVSPGLSEWRLEHVEESEQKSLFDENIDDSSEIIDWDELKNSNVGLEIEVAQSSSKYEENIDSVKEIEYVRVEPDENSLFMPEAGDQGEAFESNQVEPVMEYEGQVEDDSTGLDEPVSEKMIIDQREDLSYESTLKPQMEAQTSERPDQPELFQSGISDTNNVTSVPVSPFELDETGNEFQYPVIPGFDRVSQVDYWVKYSGDKDVGRESVLAQFRELANGISKSCQVYGLKIPEKTWRPIQFEAEDARFGDLVVTIQLVDQNGPITQDDLARFSHLTKNLSEGIGRKYTLMAPLESALLQGQSISDFVNYYESVFVINVRPVQSEYFDGTTIVRCATQLGLDQSPKNYFVRNKSVGKGKVSLYYLANMSDTGEFDFENMKEMRIKGVTFFTKPAVNRSPGAVFSEMVDTAKAFAARAKGEAISPGRENLSQDEVDDIRQSIEKVASEMEEFGIAPGNEEAMRIF